MPITKDSFLAKLIREVNAKHPGLRDTGVKVIEIPGTPLMAGTPAINPFRDKQH